ncbi:MAG TPA: glycosyltransferase family 2 protein [Propionibacteriaceae bacterium]|nr:glycosyltransferase family 2 protein [Propionibacteriaceae bacterium]
MIPVYNPGEYFTPCIESLTSQSLPQDEFEIICIDDGSTDDTPERLDKLAATYPNFRVIHQPNSGWPGQPRNVGLDAARGEYVFFSDHDDWLGTEALERLYDFATSCGSDVVLPKMAGLQRRIPRVIFRETIRQCTISDSSIMDSLTPHKLFRRDFLNEHQIRFPEGKRRLEDHHFVVTSYLLAKVVSVYADSTCYFHIRRVDEANAGLRKTNWRGYFDNLADAIDVVVKYTEPGAERNRIFRRWLQVEMVQRLTRRRRESLADDEAAEIFSNAHRIAARYFDEGVVELLQPLAQRVARAIIAGDAKDVQRVAEESASWLTYPSILQAGWVGGRLEISGTVQLTDVRPAGEIAPGELDAVDEAEAIFAEMPDEPLAEKRFAALLGELAPETLWLGLANSTIRLDLTERDTGETWPVLATVHRMGLATSFSAEIDPNTLAAGARLADGLWDLYLHYGVLGLAMRRRTTLTPERRPGRALPELVKTGLPTMAAYFTRRTSGLSLDVGLIKHPKLRAQPKPGAAARRSPFARRAVRKLRRMLTRA